LEVGAPASCRPTAVKFFDELIRKRFGGVSPRTWCLRFVHVVNKKSAGLRKPALQKGAVLEGTI
jgi:hypothetical protein